MGRYGVAGAVRVCGEECAGGRWTEPTAGTKTTRRVAAHHRVPRSKIDGGGADCRGRLPAQPVGAVLVRGVCPSTPPSAALRDECAPTHPRATTTPRDHRRRRTTTDPPAAPPKPSDSKFADDVAAMTGDVPPNPALALEKQRMKDDADAAELAAQVDERVELPPDTIAPMPEWMYPR